MSNEQQSDNVTAADAGDLWPERIRAALKSAELGMGSRGRRYDGELLSNALEAALKDADSPTAVMAVDRNVYAEALEKLLTEKAVLPRLTEEPMEAWTFRCLLECIEKADKQPEPVAAQSAVDERALVVPAGWQLVPTNPTLDMIISGHESEPSSPFSPYDEVEAYEAMSGCQRGHHFATLCYRAMLAAAPVPPAADQAGAV